MNTGPSPAGFYRQINTYEWVIWLPYAGLVDDASAVGGRALLRTHASSNFILYTMSGWPRPCGADAHIV